MNIDLKLEAHVELFYVILLFLCNFTINGTVQVEL